MDTCAKCGAGLGVGRFCLNCGHRIGDPVPAGDIPTAPVPGEPGEPGPPPTKRPRQLRVRDAPSEPPLGAGAPRDHADAAWLLDEVDDDVDGGPARLNWGAWVVAAVALIAGVLLALSFIDGDATTGTDDPAGSPASTPSAAGGTSGDGASAPPGAAADMARGADVAVPATAPPTTDLDGSLVSYEADRMVDGSPMTAWRMPGDGTGAEITVTLDEPAVIHRVGLINGYAKQVAGVDWYPHNRRILGVRWTFDDGTSVEQVLSESPRLQRMDVDPVRTRTVTLALTRVTTPGGGGLGRDYTPISTLVLIGRPAG